MTKEDLEMENQHLRKLLTERDETIQKIKTYIENELKGGGQESSDLIGHELSRIIDGSLDPRKEEHG